MVVRRLVAAEDRLAVVDVIHRAVAEVAVGFVAPLESRKRHERRVGERAGAVAAQRPLGVGKIEVLLGQGGEVQSLGRPRVGQVGVDGGLIERHRGVHGVPVQVAPVRDIGLRHGGCRRQRRRDQDRRPQCPCHGRHRTPYPGERKERGGDRGCERHSRPMGASQTAFRRGGAVHAAARGGMRRAAASTAALAGLAARTGAVNAPHHWAKRLKRLEIAPPHLLHSVRPG